MKWPFLIELDRANDYISIWKNGMPGPETELAAILESQLPDLPKAGEVWETEDGLEVIVGPMMDDFIFLRSIWGHDHLGVPELSDPHPMNVRKFMKSFSRVNNNEKETK